MKRKKIVQSLNHFYCTRTAFIFKLLLQSIVYFPISNTFLSKTVSKTKSQFKCCKSFKNLKRTSLVISFFFFLPILVPSLSTAPVPLREKGLYTVGPHGLLSCFITNVVPGVFEFYNFRQGHQLPH